MLKEQIANHSERLLKLDLQLFADGEEDYILPDDFQEAEPQAEEIQEEPVQSELETNQTEQTGELTEETQEETQSQKIKIKYNHQEQEIPYEEAVPLIQKGMNYDKIQQQAGHYQQQLQEIAQITGYRDVNELLQAIEHTKQQQQEEMYRQAGVDPETFNQLLENHPDIQFAKQLKTQQEIDQRFMKEAEDLFQTFPDLKADDVPKEVWEMHAQGIPLKFAYMQMEHSQLKNQVKVLKQNEENTKKAPLTGLSAHGSAEVAAEDDFLRGFDSI